MWNKALTASGIVIGIIALLVLLGVALAAPGCAHPPTGTVWVDTNANGVTDSLAMDANKDGVPDLDTSGKPIILATGIDPAKVEALDKIDEAGPGIAEIAAGLLAGPVPWAAAILAGVAAVWRGSKFGRQILNMTLAIQSARAALKTSGATGALAVVDSALSQVQLADVKALVAKVKAAQGIPSVTDSLPTQLPAIATPA